MKREIRFRLWNPEREVLTAGLDMNTIICTSDIDFVNDFDKKGMIWMQYTGMRDRNGKEIYEGDIVISKGDVSVLYVVKFGQYMYSDACFFLEEISDTNPPLRFFSRGIDQTEIIGNIYQNPELLESAS